MKYRFFRLQILLVAISLSITISAQFRTDRLIDIGRSALYYEDYVLSIQYFNQVINVKPYLNLILNQYKDLKKIDRVPY